MFGTWDGGHFDLLVFLRTTWTEIAADSLPYVNAEWSQDPPGHYFAPWMHGYEYRADGEWPPHPSAQPPGWQSRDGGPRTAVSKPALGGRLAARNLNKLRDHLVDRLRGINLMRACSPQ